MPNFRLVVNTSLYTEVIESGQNQTTNHGPLAYFIPPSTSTLPPLITMDHAWQFWKYSGLRPGYFLFFQEGVTIPPTTRNGPTPQLTAFLDFLAANAPPMRVRTATGFAWVEGDPNNVESLSVQFLETAWNPVAGAPATREISTQSFVQQLKYRQIGLVIGENMPVVLDNDLNGFTITHVRSPQTSAPANTPTDRGLLQRGTPTGPTENIWVHGADGGKIDKVGRSLTMPLFGEDRGAIELPLESLVQQDFQPNALDSALYYFAPGASADQFQALRFPVIDLNVNGATATTQTQIDLELNLYAAQPEHSYFDYKVGQGGDGGGGRGTSQAGGDPPVIGSFLRTYDGHNIHVAPTRNSRMTGTHKPNHGGWTNYPTQLGPLLYFSPHGSFEMVMDDPPPAETWLLGGFAGTEYISFTPRNGSTRGDVVTFYPHQGAFAPKFGSPTPASGGDLLTLAQRTSWVSVESFEDAGNDPPIQYFAQPDDAPLFGPETSGSTNPYLVFKSIPANTLPVPASAEGLDSFPLAPFAGVTAPDPQVDETVDIAIYRSYEQTVLSPQRKERISSVAQTTRARSNGRTLEQAGNENTTTPQGILATINGADYVDLTLADNENNLLKLDQISEELQDSLQTNRLFMPISLGSTLNWANNGVNPQNFITIEGWPFEIEVGEPVPGAPEDTDQLYNVIVFKYYDRTFEELVEDTSFWSYGDHFNTGNGRSATDVQNWLRSVIADARAKAADPETAALYQTFVSDIVENPDWNGIIALNVKIPLHNLPSAVQGLLSGIQDPGKFVAHHIGINVSKIAPDASKIERSSLFGLIDYTDPGDGTPPTGDYDFRVGILRILFSNTEIASFEAKIYLTLNLLFDEPSQLVDGSGNPTGDNAVELIGTYENHDGKPTYTFKFEGEDAFDLGIHTPVIQKITLSKVIFVTISGPEPTDIVPTTTPADVVSEFQFWGVMEFVEGEAFDFFSYATLGFSGLKLGVRSGWTADGEDWLPALPPEYTFRTVGLSLDAKTATTRTDSLMANFPLILKGFSSPGEAFTFTLSDLGAIPVPGLIPGTTPLLGIPKYMLEFHLALGTPGATLPLKHGFTINILAGWTPSTSSDGGGILPLIRLPLASGNSMEIGIQGVLTFKMKDFGFAQIPGEGDDYIYAFFLNSAALKVLGTQIPPGGTFSLLLFVPKSGTGEVNVSNIGWFVAYQADEAVPTNALACSGFGPPEQNSAGPDVEALSCMATLVPAEGNPNEVGGLRLVVCVRNNHTEPAEGVSISLTTLPNIGGGRPEEPRWASIGNKTIAPGAVESFQFDTIAGSPPSAGTYRFNAEVMFAEDTVQNNSKISNVITVNPSNLPQKPAPPILKLKYFGVGQRVGFPDRSLANPPITSVEGALSAMGGQIVPLGKTGNALVAHLDQVYDPNSGWMVGADFTLFNVLRFAFVFFERDEMYGALIGFVDDAPAFIKGFQFQILYKKVNDNLGVFMMQLKLPDALRKWQFGVAALTLPIIGLDIYTNGNFKIDFGFPYKFDFSRSLTVEIQAAKVPLQGSIGFYFAVLNSDSSTTVPKLRETSTAKFDPVLEIGIGFSIGVGKSIDKGILRAGLTIAFQGLLEGTIAWYIPPDADGTSSALAMANETDGLTRSLLQASAVIGDPPNFYKFSGQFQIVGRLYGEVDFGIIKVGVSLEIYVRAGITFEAYADLLLYLEAGVRVKASVTIAFVEINFSFSATIRAEFLVKAPFGPPEDAPWYSELESTSTSARALAQVDELLPVPWVDKPINPTPVDINVYFAPHLVPAGSQANVVLNLLIPFDPEGDAAADFDNLLDAMLTWAVEQGGYSGDITERNLNELLERLNIPTTLARTVGDPLDYDELRAFLATNFTFHLLPAFDAASSPSSATYFPVVPDMEVSFPVSNGNSTIDFATLNPRDEAFQDDLAEYFALLLVDFQTKQQANPTRAFAQAGAQSMATIVFQDYFAFLVKNGLEEVRQKLEADGTSGSITDILTSAREAGIYAKVAAMTARYFYHGLRLPEGESIPDLTNDPSAINTAGVFELTGQQIPVNAVADGGVEDIIWSMVVAPSSDDEIFADDQGSVTFTYAEADRATLSSVAATTFDLADFAVDFPAKIRSQSKEFAFRNRVGIGSNQHFFPFSEAFVDLLDEGATESVVKTRALDGKPGEGTPASGLDWKWGLRVDVSAIRLPGDDGPLPNVYQLNGTDEDTRNRIEEFIKAGPAVTNIQLLTRPGGEQGAGLVPLPGNPSVEILKTNLTTQTAPPRSLAQTPPADEFSAFMQPDQAPDFMRLVWEVSVVNAGGFYLFVDGGLPDDIFVGDIPAELTILMSYDNSSAVGDYANGLIVDNSADDPGYLYVTTPEHHDWYQTLAPGSVVFDISRSLPPADGVVKENIYNLLTYWIVGDANFEGTIQGLPVGPTEDPNTPDEEDAPWHFYQAMPVARYYTGSSDPNNPYAGVGNDVTIGYRLLDVFGNPMPVAGASNLEDPMGTFTTTLKYYDPLKSISEWPAVATNHAFTGSDGNGTLTVNATFTKGVYSGQGETEIGGSEITRTQNARDLYERIRYQLNGTGATASLRTTLAPGVTSDVTGTLRAFLDEIIEYLDDLLDGTITEPVPEGEVISAAPMTLAISQASRDAVDENIFEVEVFLTIERDSGLVDESTVGKLDTATKVETRITPLASFDRVPEGETPPEGELVLKQYAIDFETAFPEMKLATGTGNAGPQSTWAIRIGAQGISAVVDSSKPQFFAPAPLSTTLLSRDNVTTFPNGPDAGASVRNFSGVDMDVIGREFVQAVDGFLSAKSAAPSRAANPDAYKRILQAKQDLADGISLGVTNVLTGGSDDDLAAAREAFKQRLLVGLSGAYELETVVQYPVTTTNPNAPATPPNLYGRVASKAEGAEGEIDHEDADYTLSSAKIQLNGGSTHLTFLFDASRQVNQASIAAGMEYRVTHIEHDIEDVEFVVSDSYEYQASSWLTLVQPVAVNIDDNAFVPLALREYPTPPTLVTQTATQQSLNGTMTLETAPLWVYDYTYSQRSIAQDTILSSIRFNVPQSTVTRALAQEQQDLFYWLARFSVEYQTLKTKLADLDNLEAADIEWFAQLVEGAAATWGAWVTGASTTRALQQALNEFEWKYQINEVYEEDQITITVTRTTGPDTRFPAIDAGTGDVIEPDVDGDNATYIVPFSGELPLWHDRKLIIDDLDVLNVENGWGGIHLARNLNLSQYEGRETNPAFIYQTPMVRFVNKVTPLIDARAPINIPNSVSGGGTSLAGYLETLFATLFASALDPGAKPRLVKLGVRYGFDARGQQTVAEGPGQGDEIIVELPVLQRMPFEYLPNDPATLAGELAQEMEEWFDEVQPLTSGGYYDIDLSVFAALTNTELPVLRIRHLWIGLDQIS